MRMHPHAEASYRVVPYKDDTFAVEVLVPDTQPATVSPFASKSAAEAWITEHQRRVQSQAQIGRGFRSFSNRSR